MTLARYEHSGDAPLTGLSLAIGADDSSFTVLSGTGYPTGAVGDFVICIDAGTATEEKILCSARSTATFTVASGGRGYDSTTAQSHSTGVTNVSHVFSAAEADDDNAHIYTTTRDDHTQYAKTDGSRNITGDQTFAAGISVTGGTAAVTGNATVGGTLGVTGAATVGGTLGVTGDTTLDGTLSSGAVTSSGAISGTTVTGSGEVEGTDFNATGLTGATAGGRYVGATTAGAPASGTFEVGDFVVDQTGAVWVCVTAGTPGTWSVPVGGLVGYTSGPGSTTDNQNTTTALITLTVSLVSGLKYVVGARHRGQVVTASLTSASTALTDDSSLLQFQTMPLYSVNGTIAANDVLAGGITTIVEPGSNVSAKFTLSATSASAGSLRTSADNAELYVMRVA